MLTAHNGSTSKARDALGYNKWPLRRSHIAWKKVENEEREGEGRD